MKHTPTPWERCQSGLFSPDKQELYCKAEEDIENPIGYINEIANAAFIVRAVNCHEELLAFAKKAHMCFNVPVAGCQTCDLIAKAEGL